jgi:DMSO/TMAO reductase YedYZ molybdopterin-dependent catalytic subunit
VPAWHHLVVDGLVARPLCLSLEEVAAFGGRDRNLAVHCVWGWSRSDPTWTGVDLGTVLAAAGPLGTWVTVRAASERYSSCLPIADAAHGLLAWARDGLSLPADAGGPLRFLPPADYWGYKGVKWAARVRVGSRFVPGPWETKVADPIGRIPDNVERP